MLPDNGSIDILENPLRPARANCQQRRCEPRRSRNRYRSLVRDEIQQLLSQFYLGRTTGVSVLTVEMMPRYDQYIIFGQEAVLPFAPFSQQLGQYRILRTSPLVAAPEIC
jgi:hypothetical protein